MIAGRGGVGLEALLLVVGEYAGHAILKGVTMKSFRIMHFNMIKICGSDINYSAFEGPEQLGMPLVFLILHNTPVITAAQPDNSKSDVCPDEGRK